MSWRADQTTVTADSSASTADGFFTRWFNAALGVATWAASTITGATWTSSTGTAPAWTQRG